MSYLIDSNQLLYAANPRSPHFAETTEALRLLIAGRHEAFVTSQTLTEFWRGATRGLDAAPAGLGLTSAQAAAQVAFYRATFDYLPDVPAIFEELMRLATLHSVQSAQIHDARLVAVMHTYGVDCLLTTNARHFRRFPSIRAVTPAELPALLRAEPPAGAEGLREQTSGWQDEPIDA